MEQFQRLFEIIKILRGMNGCPWDREQTTESMTQDIIEETYEVIDAIESGCIEDLEEELGDLFFLTLFVAYIAEQEKKLTVANVLQKIADKLIRRHPHVFNGLQVDNVDKIVENWESIKLSENKNLKRKTPFDGIPKGLPEVQRFFKIMEKIKLAGGHIPEIDKKDLSDSFHDFLYGTDRLDSDKFIDLLLTYCFLNNVDLSVLIRKISNQKIQDFLK